MGLLTLDFWVYLLLGAIALIVGLSALAGLHSQKDAAPNVQAVLKALEPYAYKAIMAGERAILWGIGQAEGAIDSTDKKAVADRYYDLLPDVIMVGAVPVPSIIVKRLVPREDWEDFVKSLYDGANAALHRNEVYLKSAVDALNPAKQPNG